MIYYACFYSNAYYYEIGWGRLCHEESCDGCKRNQFFKQSIKSSNNFFTFIHPVRTFAENNASGYI